MKAFITGISGQDGSYLSEFLLEKGYQVFGSSRHPTSSQFERLEKIRDRVTLFQADPLEPESLSNIIEKIKPEEVYNLTAQSFVPASWNDPSNSAEITGVSVARVLEAIRKSSPETRFYQASTSEMFGKALKVPQDEETPFNPRSPYGVSKVFGHHLTANYRDSYKLFAVSGILYNHESPRRGPEFVTRKITKGVAEIKKGLAKELRLGNLDISRDWGFAGDYVKAMWLMLQQKTPSDFVIASGKSHTVREFCKAAFSLVGLNYEDYVIVDPNYVRPQEMEQLVGDPSKAKRELGWEAQVSFVPLIEMMVKADLDMLVPH